jgi:hypothetical protein
LGTLSAIIFIFAPIRKGTTKVHNDIHELANGCDRTTGDKVNGRLNKKRLHIGRGKRMKSQAQCVVLSGL